MKLEIAIFPLQYVKQTTDTHCLALYFPIQVGGNLFHIFIIYFYFLILLHKNPYCFFFI